MKDLTETIVKTLDLLQSWRLSLKLLVAATVFILVAAGATELLDSLAMKIRLPSSVALALLGVISFSAAVLLVESGIRGIAVLQSGCDQRIKARSVAHQERTRRARIVNYLEQLLPRLSPEEEAELSAFFFNDTVEMRRTPLIQALEVEGVLKVLIPKGPAKATFQLAPEVVSVISAHYGAKRKLRMLEYIRVVHQENPSILGFFFQAGPTEGEFCLPHLSHPEYMAICQLATWNIIDVAADKNGGKEWITLRPEAIPVLEEWAGESLKRTGFTVNLDNVDGSGASGGGAGGFYR